MKILLVDSPDIKESLAEQVRDFLVQFPGKWQFDVSEKAKDLPDYYQDEDFDTDITVDYSIDRPYLSIMDSPRIETWDDIFLRLKKYRERHDIPNDVFILMFTAERNENNWFGMFDLGRKPQGFVQSSYWDEVVSSEAIYPILYESVAVPLLWRLFKKGDEAMKYIHKKPIGCIHDFCENKDEIILKLQTGNICQKCYDGLLASGLSEAELDQIDTILDAIRLKFREFNLRRKKRKPIPVIVTKEGRNIQIGDVVLKLRPLDKALYLFFLDTEISVRTSDLPEYENSILDFYKPLYTGDSNDDMVRNVGRLVSNEDGITNQSVSRVNRALDKLVIEELTDHYKILTGVDGYKSVKAGV